MTRSPFVPLRPDHSAVARPRAGDAVIRACCAELISAAKHGSVYPRDVLRQNWPRDEAADLVLRGAVEIAISTDASGQAIAPQAVADFLVGLGPASAGSQLLGAGLALTFGGAASILVPNIVSAAGNAGFVAQGAPIPIRELTLDTSTLLTPRAFKTITTFTRETFQHTIPTVEKIVRQVLVESVVLSLDVTMLDATAGDSARPPGLRNGIAAGVPSANPDLNEAALEDIDTVIGGVADIAGNYPIMLVTAPKRARRLKLRMLGRDLGFTLLGSAAVGADEIIAIASNSLVSAVDPNVAFDASDRGVLHMDTTPGAISAVGAPATVSAPTRSLFQSDTIALRLRFGASWGLRNAGGLAWLENLTW